MLDALIKEKVDVAFGYPGGVVIPLFDVLYDAKKVEVILTRHEQAAAHAADGYSRVTGKTGVCIATSGPGATNLMTGIATAYLDSVPMVAITGQVSTPLLGTDAFQEADIVGISRPITKHNFLVKTIEELPLLLKKAFYIAKSGRPGPVLIDIPKNIFTSKLKNYSYPTDISIRGYKPRLTGHARQLKKAASLIEHAKKPVIFAGGGIIIANAHNELKELAEKINIPVITSFMGIGGFPTKHQLYLGMPGMHGSKSANTAIQESDLLISIGVRFDDRVTGKVDQFAPNAKIIHMDIDPAAISKIIDVDVPVVGDAKKILSELLPQVTAREAGSWTKKFQKNIKNEQLYSYKESSDTIKPQYVVAELCEQTKGEAIVTTEVGQNQMWAAHYYSFSRPRSFISSGGLGTMGFGLPAAMGAAVACPDSVVVDIAGDGSIQMNIQELATISNNNIPVKIVILNNEYLGMVRQWQELFFDKRYSKTCLRGGRVCKEGECDGPEKCKRPYLPDFIALAQSYDIPAYRAVRHNEVDDVLRKGLAEKGPVLMEFIVEKEENVFPMVAPGESIDSIMEE